MTSPLAIFGVDVGDLVEDAIRALVDLVVPDFGSQWVSSLVTWLVALPPVTGSAFPSLNSYADQLTAVGFGILGACFLGGLLQFWAGGSAGAAGLDAVRRAAIGAGALATYTTVLQSLLVGVNVLTAEMIKHPLVVDGLDKAFGEALTVAVVTGGVSLGLAIGAAIVVLYFVAALFVLKIGLTALLAVAVVAGALVWGLYPLPQAQWLARAWLSGLVAALAVPVAWACVFSAAALLGRDTLVFEGGGQFNNPLGETLGYLVKPFAAVACFWIAYRAPYFLLGIARTAGLSSAVFRGGSAASRGGGGGGNQAVSRGARSSADRFRAFFVRTGSTTAASASRAAASRGRSAAPGVAGTRGGNSRPPGGEASTGSRAERPAATKRPRSANDDARRPGAAAPAARSRKKPRPAAASQSPRDPKAPSPKPPDAPPTRPAPKPPRPRRSAATPPPRGAPRVTRPAAANERKPPAPPPKPPPRKPPRKSRPPRSST